MIKLYNTLSKQKETIGSSKINLFVCGPTVYDFAHIGHARTYIVFDAFVKFLQQADFKVFYLQNITDIDDKIIKRAKELHKTPKALATRFEKEYFKDMKTLGVNSVKKYAKATSHIKEIISQVKRLLKKGYAYRAEDGIYFDISKFKEYGKLSGRTTEQAEDAVSRIDESVQKRNKGDFALWKLSKPGEPSWSLAVARDRSTVRMNGRPGWHIEDTAISEKYFGAQYDIHGGGIDLLFPHHEAEVTQMEAISGRRPFVKYWMHTGFLTIQGQKMSKSLGNFVTIRDFLAKNSVRVLRLLVLKTHYRSPIDYSEKLIEQTKKELERIDTFIEADENKNKVQIAKFKTAFQSALENDFNTPEALAALFELIRKGSPTKETLKFFKEADKILGFIFSKEKKDSIPAKIKKLTAIREKYRKQNNWQKADELRKQIEQRGWEIEDTSTGPKIKLAKP